MKHKNVENNEEIVDSEVSPKRQRINEEMKEEPENKDSPEEAGRYSESILDSASTVGDPQLTEQDIADILETNAEDDNITEEKAKSQTVESDEDEENFENEEEEESDDAEEEDADEIEILETTQSTLIVNTVKKSEPIELNGVEESDEVVEEMSLTWNEAIKTGKVDVPITVDSSGFDWKVFGVVPAPASMKMEATYKQIEGYRAKFLSAFKNFNNKIWKHLQLNYQNDSTFSWKMRMRKMLHDFIAQIYAESSLIAVGSTVNGCGSYNSDMDLCLCIPDSNSGYHTDRQYATKILSNLARRMRKWNSNLIKTVQFIRAKVPILKLTFHPPYDELEVDLNCNNVAGIYNSHLLHYYARIDDRFPALCLLVKHWAIKHEINDAQMGTFNSYSLILMVLHFLQSVASPPVLPNLQKLYPETFSGVSDIDRLGLFMDLSSPLPEHPPNERTIGELLIAFIDYYARFDFENLAISVSRACTFSRWMLPENTQRFKIYIEEPFDGLNTARCVTSVEMFNRIKLAFKTSRSQFLGSQAGPPNLKRIKVDV